MEHNSTKGNDKKNVPGQDDFWSEFDFQIPEIKPIPEIDLAPLDSFSRQFQQESQRLMAQFLADSERMMQEADKWIQESQAAIDKRRQDMTFREYVDSEGYQVMEGKSKDGYTVIQRRKQVGKDYVDEIEIYKDVNLMYKSSSLQNFFSYRKGDGQMVTVDKERKDEKRGNENTYRSSYGGTTVKTSHATIKKRPRRKKSTNTWKWLLIVIAVAVVYVMFLR